MSTSKRHFTGKKVLLRVDLLMISNKEHTVISLEDFKNVTPAELDNRERNGRHGQDTRTLEFNNIVLNLGNREQSRRLSLLLLY